MERLGGSQDPRSAFSLLFHLTASQPATQSKEVFFLDCFRGRVSWGSHKGLLHFDAPAIRH